MMPPFDVMDQGRMTVAFDAAGAAFGLWQAKAHHGIARYGEPGTVSWNELHTRDYQKSRDFYSQVFGYTYTDLDGGDDFTYATIERSSDAQSVGGISHDTSLAEGMPTARSAEWLSCKGPRAKCSASSSHPPPSPKTLAIASDRARPRSGAPFSVPQGKPNTLRPSPHRWPRRNPARP
jgi:predicted enzyme related to lactoylglutathione lyase